LGRLLSFLLAATAPSVWAGSPSPAQGPLPLLQAHSHNDNERSRPLAEALEDGFCSVEADVNLIDGRLLVGHSEDETRPGATLEALYLEPLLERVRRNGGRVYPGGPGITLLIDIKTEARPTWEALEKVLARYAEMLTVFRDDGASPGAVTVLLSGSNPRKEIQGEKVRLAALDGQLEDLDGTYGNFPQSLMPQVSDDWRFEFDWDGTRPLSNLAQAKLRAFVEKAHAQGRRIRFYAAPDNELAWETLLDAGVDLINTNRVQALRDFLVRRLRQSETTAPRPPVLVRKADPPPFVPAPLEVP
jgi:hypothetical protein